MQLMLVASSSAAALILERAPNLIRQQARHAPAKRQPA
jgi:hypothetical protein